MKTITKVLLGLSFFLLLSGGLLALAGRAMGANTTLETNLDGYPIRLHFMGVSGGTYGATNGISGGDTTGARNLETLREIDIEVNAAGVEFRPAEDYGVELAWSRDDLALDYAVEDGRLSVWSARDQFHSLNHHKATVVVYLPQRAPLELLDLSVDMGSANLENLTTDVLKVNIEMGSVDLVDVSARHAELSSDMSDVNAQGFKVTDSLTADSNMGDIALIGDISGNVELDCDMGAITLHTTAPVSAFGYNLSADMGSIHVDGKNYRDTASRTGGSSHLEATCSMGDIDIKFGVQ